MNKQELINKLDNVMDRASTGIAKVAFKIAGNYARQLDEPEKKVCEWRRVSVNPDGNNYGTSCKESIDIHYLELNDNNRLLQIYRHCPNCGGKIKEVKE